MAFSRKAYIIIAEVFAATLNDYEFKKQEDVDYLINRFAIHLENQDPDSFDRGKFIMYVREQWAARRAS